MAVDVKFGSTFETSAPKALFQTQVVRYGAPNRYVVTRDGQRFLVSVDREDASNAPAAIVLNWTADLKK